MRKALIFTSAILFMLSGCGPQVITTPPSKRMVSTIESGSRETPPPPRGQHPTQRPYKINGKSYYPLPSADGYKETGIASWYGEPFHGRKTSNGETYNMYDWTAAHKTLPMNTYLLVENLDTGRNTTVRINDRGPFVKGRIIDLSYNVARKLGVVKKGTARVRITALGEAETIKAGNITTTRFLPHQDFNKGEFFVQIGSFTNKDNADRLKEQMINWDKKAVTLRYDRGDKVFYRVQVRAGTTMDSARRSERVLTEAGFPGAFIVAR
ncbi:MAG TPA: septal ring lytic transglycosylase RlpA family protein [Deltaproteobacteria bacterium]|nr:septal ring lytic transglycosylase RlpA family protein [Deltaproteobacteria bacterium]